MNFVLQLQKKSCKTRSCEGGGEYAKWAENFFWKCYLGKRGKAGDGGCLRYSDAWQIFKKQRLPLLRW